MNKEQIIFSIDAIDNFLKENYPNIAPEPVMDEVWVQQEYAHLKYMVSKMREMTELDDQETKEKLMRWIGFAQGALWCIKKFTINQLREMNTHGNS